MKDNAGSGEQIRLTLIRDHSMNMKVFRTSMLAILLTFSNAAHADLQKAKSAYGKGKYQVALAEYMKLVQAGKAARQERITAQYMVGVMYANGEGVPQDHAEAARWFRKAAEQGDAKAQFNLAVQYANGEGVTQNFKEAVSWYYLAAEQGHADAQNNLGVMYYRGQGVPTNLIRAYKWISLASAAGNASATDNRKEVEAHMTPRQIEEAQSFVKPALQGDAKALFDFGVLYAKGQGVSRDDREAMSWYYMAAQKGLPSAQNSLGVMYYRGLGVPTNLVQAYKWISLASANGNEEATANRKVVAARMTPRQIEEAQSLAADWRSSHKNILPPQAQGLRSGSNEAVKTGKAAALPDANQTNASSNQMGSHAGSAGNVVAAKVKPATGAPPLQKKEVAQPAFQGRTTLRNSGESVAGAPIAARAGNAAPKPLTASAVQDLSLDQAIAIAKETSFRLGRSQRFIDGSVARYNAASALYRPRLDSNIYATESKHDLSQAGALGQVPQFIGGLNLAITQPLDIGGVIGHQVTQAELARRAAEFDLAQSYLDVSLEVAINYYSALRAQEIMRVDQSIVRDLEHLVKEIGESPGSVNSFIQVELANAQQTFSSSYTIFDLSFETLKQSLRLPPGTMIRLTDGFSYGPVADLDNAQTIQEALAKRPDIGQIGVRIEQTKLAAEQVDDSRKPTLNLQLFSNNAYYSRSPGSAFDAPLTYDRGVMVMLNIPLAYFDWGYLNETKKSVLLQNEQAKFDLQEQLERAGLEVRQAMIALKRAEQRVKTLPDLALAHDTLRRAEHDYLAAGNRTDPATLAQMSNARAGSRLAETVTIDALYEYNVAILNLKHAIGARPPSVGAHTARSLK